MEKVLIKKKIKQFLERIREIELPDSPENKFLFYWLNLIIILGLLLSVVPLFKAIYNSIAYYVPIIDSLSDVFKSNYFIIVVLISLKSLNTQYIKNNQVSFYNIFWASINSIITILILILIFIPITTFYLGNDTIRIIGIISFLEVLPINFFLIIISLLLAKLVIAIKIK